LIARHELLLIEFSRLVTASSRNGGMVLTGLKKGPETLITRYALEVARRLYAASLASIDCVEQIVKDEGIRCDFSRTVTWRSPSSRNTLMVSRQRRVNRPGIPPYADHCAEEGDARGDRLRGVSRWLVDETSGWVNPARLVAGLQQLAVRNGAQLYDRTRVERSNASLETCVRPAESAPPAAS
jgi:glycine/D-amino acid oxidase-like deaminating enzyme